jgi:hypothetical protein
MLGRQQRLILLVEKDQQVLQMGKKKNCIVLYFAILDKYSLFS